MYHKQSNGFGIVAMCIIKFVFRIARPTRVSFISIINISVPYEKKTNVWAEL